MKKPLGRLSEGFFLRVEKNFWSLSVCERHMPKQFAASQNFSRKLYDVKAISLRGAKKFSFHAT